MGAAASRLQDLIRAEPGDLRPIADLLDGLTHADRVDAIRTLGGTRLQGRLWAAAAAAPRVTLGDLVPADATPLREVIFEGKNSLPAFTIFQKRFCRPAGGGDTLWGYNQADLGWLIGPGYFVVHDDPQGAAIDYREVPPRGCDGWPAVKPNSAGLSRFVYDKMVDYMRRVSRDVFIGSATKHGREIGSYFILARKP